MAYYYTPQSQIDAAKRRISSNNAAQETALSSLLAMAEQADQSEQAQPQATTENTEKAGFFRRALETTLDWFESVELGFRKALEGVIDFGMSATGVIAGWAGDEETKQQMADFVAVDAGGEYIQSLKASSDWLAASNSYINDMSSRGQRIVRGIGEGVGQMIPLIVLSAGTGGIANAAEGAITASKGAATAAKVAGGIRKAGQVANLALLGMSAAGTGTEQALNYQIDNGDGTTRSPSLDHAFLYGLASGAVEVATETLVGGPYEKVFGSGVADKMINKLAKSTGFNKAVKFAIGAVGEGVEEVVSEAVSNTLQTLYMTDEGIKGLHWEDPNVQDMFEAGVIGAITSAVISGGNVAVRKASNTMSVQDHITDAQNIERRLENLSAKDSLDTNTATRLQAEYEKNMRGIVKRYNAASEKTRAKMWKSTPGLSQYINEDGTRRTVELAEGAQAITAEQAQSPAMSQALFAHANEVANDLHEHGTTIAENMSEEEILNTRKLRAALKKAGANTGTTLKVVVAEHLAGSNAFVKGDVMYISKDRVGSIATMADDFAHETMHFARGSKEYQKHLAFLRGTSTEVAGKKVDVWAMAIDAVAEKSTSAGVENGYKISKETIEAFIKGDPTGLAAQQMKEWDLLEDEVVAHANEIVLGNKEYIEELVESDRSLAKAYLKKIKRTINIVKAAFSGDKATLGTIKWLQMAEHSFENALAASGEKYLRGKTGATDEGEETEQESKRVDTEGKKEYTNDDLWRRLTKQEQAMLYAEVSKINNLHYYEHRLPNGDYIIDVKDKIIISDGEHYQPTIKGIVELASYKNQVWIARDYFYENISNGRTIQECIEFINRVCQEEVASLYGYDDGGRNSQVNRQRQVAEDDRNGDARVEERARDGRQTRKNVDDDGTRHSLRQPILPNSAEEDVIARYGKTYQWSETGYITPSGVRIDLSGKNEGGRGGYRAIDHRDIFDEYDVDGVDAMVEFMSRGNIRVMPEAPAINLQIEPTDEQYRLIGDLVERLGWKEKEFTVDFDDEEGNTKDSLRYEGNVSWRKVVSDIRYYFKEGKVPHQSELSKYRYSLRSSLAAETQYTREEIDALLAEVLSGESDVFKGFSIKNDEGVRRNHSQAERNRAASAIAKALSVDGGRITGKLSKTALATVQKLVADYWQDPTSNGNAEETAWAVADKIIELATGEDNEATADADATGGEYYRQKAIRDAGRKLKNSLRFDDFITGELRHAFDESGLKGLRLQWGAPKGDGMGYDQFAQAIVEENGIEAYAEYAANEDAYKPEDVIIDFFKKYKAASEYLAGYDKTIPLTELLDESGIEEICGKIGRVLLYTHLGFDVTDNGFTLRMDGMKGAIGEYAWQKLQRLDGDHRAKAIDQVADYIMQSVMLQDSNVATDAAYGKAVLDALKPYLRKVDLSTVKRALASDEKGYKSITSRWAGKGGMSVNEFLQKVKEAGIKLNATDAAEQLLEIDALYEEARAAIEGAKRTASKAVGDVFNAEERATVKQELVALITKSLDAKGKPTQIAELVKKYEQVIKEQREALKEGRAYNKAVNQVLDLIERLKPNGSKHRSNGSYLEDPTFNAVTRHLGKIKYRSDIRKRGARAIFAGFAQWYNKANPLLNGGLDAGTVDAELRTNGYCGYLQQETLDILDYFTKNVSEKGPLTLDEVRMALKVLQQVDYLVKNYDKVRLGDKQVRLSEAATQAHATADKYSGMRSHRRWVFETLRKYGYAIVEPRVVLADMFGYEDNALLQAFDDITAGETRAGLVRLEMLSQLDDFFKEHKKYKARLAKDKVTVNGREITVGYALSLYMLTHQQDSIAGIKNSGWGYYDKNNYWVDCGTMTDEDIKALEGELSKADKDFLKVVRTVLDRGGELLRAAQIDNTGSSNIETENSDYFPIRRCEGDFARTVEQSMVNYFMQLSVAHSSITKERVNNERRVSVYDIVSVLETHSKQIGDYVGLAGPLATFQRIYNANVAKGGSTPVSVRQALNGVWSGAGEYITDLLKDIQGMNGKKSTIDRIVEGFRGNYAKFQLGFNIKVIFSQMASYPTAFTDLSIEALGKAFTKKIDGKDMDKYCDWARVRNYNHSVVLAESVTDKIGKVGDALTKPIQWTDRLTISVLWNACQFEVERRHKGDSSYKVGSEQNKREAGKLLEQVGRRTQPNYTASERSALQRNKSQFAKAFSMFSSVPLKQLSRLVEAVGRERAIRYKKNVLHENVSAAELKAAHTYTAKAITAVTVANIIYVAMGQAIKSLLAKDRKDKDGDDITVVEDFFRDFGSTTFGMLPFFKEVYNWAVFGFESEDFVNSGINGVLSSTKDVYDGITALASGEPVEDKDIAKPLRSFAYALGQAFGVPTRNAYNLVFGLIKRFDPAKAYEIDSMFTSNSVYSRDLKKAVEAGDENKATTIIGLMLKDDGMTSTTPKVNEKLRSLYEAGYSVLPRTVKDSIVYDGETIELSRRSQNAFKSVYGKANDEVEALIDSSAFSGLTDEVQAKAIKWVYDYYYEKAVYETVGAEANSKRQLFAETMAPSKFAMTIAACSAVEGKVDRKGNTVAGSKRTAVVRLLNSLSLTRAEKALILAYLGYSVSDYAGLIRRYIAQIGLSKEQQKAFLGYINI